MPSAVRRLPLPTSDVGDSCLLWIPPCGRSRLVGFRENGVSCELLAVATASVGLIDRRMKM